MDNDYLQYPPTIKSLAAEIKKACNDYYARRITNDQIKDIILWYANYAPDKLFSTEPGQLNPTIIITIGKKRVRLILDLLHSYQQ